MSDEEPPQPRAAWGLGARPSAPRRGVLYVVLLVAILAGSLYAWRGEIADWAGGFSRSPQTDRVAELELRVAAMRERMDAALHLFEQQLNAGEASPLGTSQRLDTVDLRVARLGEQVANLAQRVEQLQANLDRRQAGDAGAAALLLASARLRSAIDNGENFRNELDTVMRLAGEDAPAQQAIGELGELAEGGVPSLFDLREQFSETEDLARQAALEADGGTWLRRTWNRLRRLVSISRDDGGIDGSAVDATLARARSAVAVGNLSAARAAMTALPAAGQEAARPWLVSLDARLTALAALDRIETYAMQKLGQVDQS